MKDERGALVCKALPSAQDLTLTGLLPADSCESSDQTSRAAFAADGSNSLRSPTGTSLEMAGEITLGMFSFAFLKREEIQLGSW